MHCMDSLQSIYPDHTVTVDYSYSYLYCAAQSYCAAQPQHLLLYSFVTATLLYSLPRLYL